MPWVKKSLLIYRETEPEFVESFEMDEVAKEALNIGDQCLAEAATLSAQFHRGRD